MSDATFVTLVKSHAFELVMAAVVVLALFSAEAYITGVVKEVHAEDHADAMTNTEIVQALTEISGKVSALESHDGTQDELNREVREDIRNLVNRVLER